mmetsp:Transcript_15687/g.32707  ORF Transcript_15687/g.32707 Transcript_15687/m.32707 type:complete len:226 (-) Transcript_15687:614-1291(-)
MDDDDEVFHIGDIGHEKDDEAKNIGDGGVDDGVDGSQRDGRSSNRGEANNKKTNDVTRTSAEMDPDRIANNPTASYSNNNSNNRVNNNKDSSRAPQVLLPHKMAMQMRVPERVPPQDPTRQRPQMPTQTQTSQIHSASPWEMRSHPQPPPPRPLIRGDSMQPEREPAMIQTPSITSTFAATIIASGLAISTSSTMAPTSFRKTAMSPTTITPPLSTTKTEGESKS